MSDNITRSITQATTDETPTDVVKLHDNGIIDTMRSYCIMFVLLPIMLPVIILISISAAVYENFNER